MSNDTSNPRGVEAVVECEHDWREYWDGSLGYRPTDCCTRCGAYRPTPNA